MVKDQYDEAILSQYYVSDVFEFLKIYFELINK